MPPGPPQYLRLFPTTWMFDIIMPMANDVFSAAGGPPAGGGALCAHWVNRLLRKRLQLVMALITTFTGGATGKAVHIDNLAFLE